MQRHGVHQRTLGDLTVIRAGAEFDAALLIDRVQRNQFAIYEPALAPLLRRFVAAADLRPWVRADSGRYLVAIPRAWGARLAALCPPLAQHLDAHAAGRTGSWWEVDVAAPAGPQISWPLMGGFAAPLDADVIPGADVVTLAGGDAAALGLINSSLGRMLLRQIAAESQLPAGHSDVVARLPIPDDDAAANEALGDCVERLVAAAAARRAIEIEGGRRTLRDLGPAGATLGATLERWWDLDFAAYRSAIARRFGGDIPERFRPEWEAWHTAQRGALMRATETMAELTGEIDRIVADYYRLTEQERAIVADSGTAS